MEQHTKHPLNILRHRDFVFTHLVHCDKDLRTSLSCNTAVLLSCACSCLMCVLLLQLSLLCVLLFPLTLVLIRDLLCKAWETPKCGDSSQCNIIEIKRTMVFKLIIGSLERRWVQPSSIGTPQHGVGKCSTWPNHGIKIDVSLVFYSCEILSISIHFTCIIALSLILILCRAIKWRSLLHLYFSLELGLSFH
jgi:hypothetical protein